MKLFFIILVLALSACTSPRHTGPKTDHFNGKYFTNPWGASTKTFWDLLKWQLSGTRVQWPEYIDDVNPQPLLKNLKKNQVSLTFINHATVYIQTENLRILTDPIWSKRASPVSWAGPTRARAASHQPQELPGVDLVLISHNHYDHFDENSIKNLKNLFDPLFLVPLGDGPLLKALGVTKFKEMDWNDFYYHESSHSKITFTRCNHWSARTPFDRNMSLWGAFVIETASKKIYFAGDTGYGSHFKEIYENWGAMDIGLIPIGAYEPRWFMNEQHVNPDEALRAHLDLKARQSFGIHFGSFQMADEGIHSPIVDLKKVREAQNIPPEEFQAPEFGVPYLIN